MCDLCTRNKKVFTHEHELFTKEELRKHEKYGDDNPGAVDQSGFKGHPECGFCRQRFYGDDELYAHCRDKHERCHLCDRRNGGRQPQYYLDYNALELHFRKDHWVCPDQECLEKKFVVFDSEMDLKAHQLEAHPNGLSKDARRDARRVDISGFDYRQPHQEERPRRQERQSRGRGRDPNAEPIPASSAQPMRRDEIAYQRQMAIHSAQSVTSRTFGGQITQPSPSEVLAARAPANAREPPAVTVPRPNPFPALGEAVNSMSLSQPASNGATPRNLSPDRSSANLTPQEQARRLRHNAVTERAANLVRNDQPKMAEFRAKVSAYRQSQMTADQLIDAFFVLFDTSAAELGKLIKELADIFELPGKRDALLKAWGNWRAINEDYPSLPGPAAGASSSGGATTAASVLGHAVGVNRVLKLKSSTQKSSQSAVGKNAGWGTAAAGPMFPPISTSSQSFSSNSNSASAIAARMGGASSSARASPAPTPNWLQSAPASARPSPPVSRTGSSANLTAPPRKDAFPALPKAAKPTSSVFSPGYTGAGVRRVNAAAPNASAWGGASGSGASSNGATTPAEDASGSAGKQVKGRKGKQQVLFNWG